jgi:hypothetical protein
MLKFVVCSFELDSVLTEGSIVDPPLCDLGVTKPIIIMEARPAICAIITK